MRFSVLYKRQKIEPNEAYKKVWTTLFVEQRAKMKGKKGKKKSEENSKVLHNIRLDKTEIVFRGRTIGS